MDIITSRKKELLKKLNRFGLVNRKGIKYILFMLYLNLYKFARRKFFQIKEFPFNLRLPRTNKLRVLVHINGGLGDAVISRLMLREMRQMFPAEKFSIFLCCKNKQTFDIFFKEEGFADFYVSRGYFLRNYDIVISGCSYMEYEYIDKQIFDNSDKKIVQFIKCGLERQKELSPFIKSDPYTDLLLAKTALKLGLNRYTLPLYMLGFDIQNSSLREIPLKINFEEKEILNKFKLESKKYITIHYDNNEKPAKDFRPTRVWPKENWQEFVKLFKQTYKDILIVQVGGTIDFGFADLCLNNKTSLAELCVILKNAKLHIDGESALVHIAACVDTKSIVLFGPTIKDYFAYPKNINIKSDKCCDCMWVKKLWRSACPLGYKIAPCMKAITPQEVLNQIEKIL
jgi:ADP-heptose:LPS heptosyltransferase